MSLPIAPSMRKHNPRYSGSPVSIANALVDLVMDAMGEQPSTVSQREWTSRLGSCRHPESENPSFRDYPTPQYLTPAKCTALKCITAYRVCSSRDVLLCYPHLCLVPSLSRILLDYFTGVKWF